MDTANTQQLKTIKRALDGENLFITGSAGTGKSYVLKLIVKELIDKFGDTKHVGVTALTGIAAISINGRTLHSFAGMGHDHTKKISFEAIPRWRNTRVLIVDEVSMLTDKFLERLYEPIVKYGIQVIFFGDFYQLAPVKGEFCFVSDVWDRLGLKKNTIELRDIIRQKDKEFVGVLNEIRVGNISKKSVEYLEKLDISNCEKIPKNITKLYSVNRGVDGENYKRLKKLKNPNVIFKARDTVMKGKKKLSSDNPPKDLPYLFDKMDKEVSSQIQLKIGAEVILTRNRNDGMLVNGSRGVITEIDNDKIPVVCFHSTNITIPIEPIEYEIDEKDYKMIRLQIPLKLSWSLTIHRCQGMTLSSVLASIDNSFANGQIYTALSRVTSPDGLIINSVKSIIERNKVSPLVSKYYETV